MLFSGLYRFSRQKAMKKPQNRKSIFKRDGNIYNNEVKNWTKYPMFRPPQGATVDKNCFWGYPSPMFVYTTIAPCCAFAPIRTLPERRYCDVYFG
jgi:hypothetical protein